MSNSPGKSRARGKPPRPPFELSEPRLLVEAGTRVDVELRVARLATGSWAHMPMAVLHGARPGPTAWVSGALHGDELNGVEIVRRLIKRISPRKLAGTLLAVPIVNVFGVTAGSRYLPDRRDLNRSFPGSPRGSMASRLARLFYEQVVERCSLGIDFHTGSNGRCNYPHLRCDLDDPDTVRVAELFRPPLVYHARMRDGSLRAAAVTAGVTALLFEGGEAHRFDERVIRLAVAGTERVLCGLGMLPSAPEAPEAEPALVRASKWMRAPRSGFAHIDVELGQRVVAGDRLGSVSDSLGRTEVSIRSRVAGMVISTLSDAHVHRGDALVHVAQLQSQDPRADQDQQQ